MLLLSGAVQLCGSVSRQAQGASGMPASG